MAVMVVWLPEVAAEEEEYEVGKEDEAAVAVAVAVVGEVVAGGGEG